MWLMERLGERIKAVRAARRSARQDARFGRHLQAARNIIAEALEYRATGCPEKTPEAEGHSYSIEPPAALRLSAEVASTPVHHLLGGVCESIGPESIACHLIQDPAVGIQTFTLIFGSPETVLIQGLLSDGTADLAVRGVSAPALFDQAKKHGLGGLSGGSPELTANAFLQLVRAFGNEQMINAGNPIPTEIF